MVYRGYRIFYDVFGVLPDTEQLVRVKRFDYSLPAVKFCIDRNFALVKATFIPLPGKDDDNEIPNDV